MSCVDAIVAIHNGTALLGWVKKAKSGRITIALTHGSVKSSKDKADVEDYSQIGQLKIEELRERASEALAEKFNIKDFHDVVLRYIDK